jgi:hypothetical protein
VYTLTLTQSERQAIDWIGHRYAHGNDLYSLLWGGEVIAFPPDADWDDCRPITFHIPEHIAWEIQRIGEEDKWACFAPEFVNKLEAFICGIV